MKQEVALSESLRFAPKYVRVREDVRRQILDGGFRPGQKIPSDAQLMARYGVSRLTVINAIRPLVREGLLTRKAVHGTFVAANPKPEQRPGVVVLLLKTGGHVFSEMAQPLIDAVHAAGIHPVIFDAARMTYDTVRERLGNILDQELRFIVVQGYGETPFDALHAKPECFHRIVFADVCETDLAFVGARSVLVDYEAGAHEAVNHLLGLGHRRIAFYTYPPNPKAFYHIHAILKGCRSAYDRHGLPADELFTTITWAAGAQPGPREIQEVLTTRERPTALFCFQDYHAHYVYTAARQLGLRVPENLSVIGFFNTPWCQVFDPPLSSVSTHPDRLGTLLGSIVTGALPASDNPVMVKPSLVLRGSCGPVPAGVSLAKTSLAATAAAPGQGSELRVASGNAPADLQVS
jgi:GntR family transcriptional regulator, arabinose operon transcriptional repressor